MSPTPGMLRTRKSLRLQNRVKQASPTHGSNAQMSPTPGMLRTRKSLRLQNRVKQASPTHGSNAQTGPTPAKLYKRKLQDKLHKSTDGIVVSSNGLVGPTPAKLSKRKLQDEPQTGPAITSTVASTSSAPVPVNPNVQMSPTPGMLRTRKSLRLQNRVKQASPTHGSNAQTGPTPAKLSKRKLQDKLHKSTDGVVVSSNGLVGPKPAKLSKRKVQDEPQTGPAITSTVASTSSAPVPVNPNVQMGPIDVTRNSAATRAWAMNIMRPYVMVREDCKCVLHELIKRIQEQKSWEMRSS